MILLVIPSRFARKNPEDHEYLKNSATYELGAFEDDGYTRTMITSSYSLGLVIAFLVFPLLVDRYGRKKIIKYCCIISGCTHSALAFSNHVDMFLSSFTLLLAQWTLRFFFLVLFYVQKWWISRKEICI